MRARTHAREVALRVLYQFDLRPDLEPEGLMNLLRRELELPEAEDFARELVEGTRFHQEAIDATIEAAAANWELKRMAVIDRNVLRLGVFELLHRPDVPPAVTINEAVELAKRYSTKESGSFVNGILDQIHKRSAQEAAAEESS